MVQLIWATLLSLHILYCILGSRVDHRTQIYGWLDRLRSWEWMCPSPLQWCQGTTPTCLYQECYCHAASDIVPTNKHWKKGQYVTPFTCLLDTEYLHAINMTRTMWTWNCDTCYTQAYTHTHTQIPWCSLWSHCSPDTRPWRSQTRLGHFPEVNTCSWTSHQ